MEPEIGYSQRYQNWLALQGAGFHPQGGSFHLDPQGAGFCLDPKSSHLNIGEHTTETVSPEDFKTPPELFKRNPWSLESDGAEWLNTKWETSICQYFSNRGLASQTEHFTGVVG